MAWLFERMIELAAWIAFVLGVICLIDALYLLVQWVRIWMSDGDKAPDLLIQSFQAAGLFVLSALAMGALACIDRYVFDLPEEAAAK
jgi:hypothetical protein